MDSYETCGKTEELISGYLDAELTQQDTQKVRLHLESCERCGKLHSEMLAVKSQMSRLSYPPSDLEKLAALEKDLTASVSAAIGWILIVVATVVAVGFGIYQFFVAEASMLEKILKSVFVVGGVFLFASVLRQRLMFFKHDKYRNVKL